MTPNQKIILDAATNGSISEINPEILTPENITTDKKDLPPGGMSAIHILAWNGQLKQLPESCLTQQTLCTKDDYGETAIENTFIKKHQDQIPEKVRREPLPSLIIDSELTPIQLVRRCINPDKFVAALKINAEIHHNPMFTEKLQEGLAIAQDLQVKRKKLEESINDMSKTPHPNEQRPKGYPTSSLTRDA